MPHLNTIIACVAVLVLGLSLSADRGVDAYPQRIAVERRDGDFDSLLSELKSKGGRMRFGKRTVKSPLEDGDFAYSPDRYIWLQ